MILYTIILYYIASYNIISSYFRLLHNVLVFPCFFLPSISSNSFPLFSSSFLFHLTLPYLTSPTNSGQSCRFLHFFKLTIICSVGDLNHTSTDTGMRMVLGSGSPLIQGQGHRVDDKNALLASTFLLSPFPLASRSKLNLFFRLHFG